MTISRFLPFNSRPESQTASQRVGREQFLSSITRHPFLSSEFVRKQRRGHEKRWCQEFRSTGVGWTAARTPNVFCLVQMLSLKRWRKRERRRRGQGYVELPSFTQFQKQMCEFNVRCLYFRRPIYVILSSVLQIGSLLVFSVGEVERQISPGWIRGVDDDKLIAAIAFNLGKSLSA